METLEQLEHRYFLLEMQDKWDSEDYKYANELKEKIKNILRKRYKIERFDKVKNKFNCVKL